MPWVELLFQVSHLREEFDLKCRDMEESVVYAALAKCSDSTNLIAPNLIAPRMTGSIKIQ